MKQIEIYETFNFMNKNNYFKDKNDYLKTSKFINDNIIPKWLEEDFVKYNKMRKEKQNGNI